MASGGNDPPERPHGQGGPSRYKPKGKPHVADDHILGHPDVLAYEGWELECVPWTYATTRAYIQMSHIICHWSEERHDATFRRMHALFSFYEHEVYKDQLHEVWNSVSMK